MSSPGLEALCTLLDRRSLIFRRRNQELRLNSRSATCEWIAGKLLPNEGFFPSGAGRGKGPMHGLPCFTTRFGNRSTPGETRAGMTSRPRLHSLMVSVRPGQDLFGGKIRSLTVLHFIADGGSKQGEPLVSPPAM